MQGLIGILHEKRCSCVVRNGAVYTFERRGVADLYDLLTSRPEVLKGADVADKVVGKGAAALMILGGVARVYADVMSEAALELYAQAGVPVTYGSLVPAIRNRAGTGFCPVETLCRDIRSAEECLPLIKEWIEKNHAAR